MRVFLLQRHPIPKNAIPCMYYKKALEDEEASRQKEKSPFPTGKDIASKKIEPILIVQFHGIF